jgi:AbrB family looped-hinge helix DNA binding protein
VAVATAKLTDKFQITIPAEVRQRLGLKAGDSVYLRVEGDRVVLSSARGGWTEGYRGLGAEVWKEAGGGKAAIERERDSWD